MSEEDCPKNDPVCERAEETAGLLGIRDFKCKHERDDWTLLDDLASTGSEDYESLD